MADIAACNPHSTDAGERYRWEIAKYIQESSGSIFEMSGLLSCAAFGWRGRLLAFGIVLGWTGRGNGIAEELTLRG